MRGGELDSIQVMREGELGSIQVDLPCTFSKADNVYWYRKANCIKLCSQKGTYFEEFPAEAVLYSQWDRIYAVRGKF